MSIEQRQVFAFASLKDEPLDPRPLARGVEIPKGFNEFRQVRDGFPVSPLSCWLEDPGLLLSRILADLPIRFPVQELFLNLYVMEENQYEAEIRLQFENASQARGMAAILNLARGFAPNNPMSAIFFANPSVQNGNNLDIKTNVLSEAEILNLFNIFFLVSG
jgi:hypothetical protein